jgi:hypothetical protein
MSVRHGRSTLPSMLFVYSAANCTTTNMRLHIKRVALASNTELELNFKNGAKALVVE